MSDIQSKAAELAEDTEHSADELESELDELVNEYRVPMDDAVSSVRSEYGIVGDHGVDPVEDVEGDENWYNLEVTVVDLWETDHESMAQVGIIGDETGTRKFVWFHGTDGIPTLEEGECYFLDGVVSDEYEGRTSVKLTTPTEVEHLEDAEIEVPENATSHTGSIVNIESGSGLIKRCPEEDCTRVLNNGRCSEHGEVEGEFDMRLKATVDDGENTPTVVFDEDAVEELSGIDLEEAQAMAQDALDTSVVSRAIADEVLGARLTVEGPEYDNGASATIYADEFDVSEGITAEAIEDALVEARSAA